MHSDVKMASQNKLCQRSKSMMPAMTKGVTGYGRLAVQKIFQCTKNMEPRSL
jgi:hypothetical protein